VILDAVDAAVPAPAPGQFTMLTVFGVGEVPISVSGATGRPGPVVLTVRAVGAVTNAVCASEPGAVLAPEHVCVLGVRSFEPEEAALAAALGVRIYTIAEIARRGLPEVLREALARVRSGTTAYGITLDLDATWTVAEDGFRSRSQNSWLIGETLQGTIRRTIADGREVYAA